MAFLKRGLKIAEAALGREVVSFVVVSIGNTLITFLVYELFLFAVPYIAAFIIAFIVGLFYMAFMNIYYVFKETFRTGNISAYVAFYVTYFFIYGSTLYVLVEFFGVPPYLAPIFVLSVLTPLSFLCTRYAIQRF